MSEKIQKKLGRRIWIPAIAVVMASLIILYNMPIYGADMESVVAIIKDGQVTDSFCGVAAEYITTQSDTGMYSCAGYVKKFYATVFGVNVYQINTYDGPPMVSMAGHSVSLKQVTTPKPGDIMQNRERTHVAVVKQVSGARATLIEQNYKWTSGGKIYARVNRVIDCQNAYFYRLVIDGRETSVNGNENYVPETYEIWRVKEASGINVRSGAGTSYGTLGTLGNGTIFYVYGKNIAGGYTWGRINYNNKAGYVALENAEYMSGVITKDSTPPVISDITVTDINSTGYTVTCKVTDDVKVDRVQFPTWTIINGQDDLCGDWDKNEKVSGTINGDRVTFRVNISEHNGETGRYATHIYAYDSSGNMSGSMIEPLYTGFENLGDKFYASISSCMGTYVTNDTVNVTARALKTAERESLSQIWKFTRQKDGSYKITSALDKTALYVKGASGISGTNIIPYTDKPSKGQNWYIYKYNGNYRLGAACSDCCMTLNGASSIDGTNIKMTTVDGTSGQAFGIEKISQKPRITFVESADYNKLTIHFSALNHVHGYKIYRRTGSAGTYRWIATVKSTEAPVYTDTHCTLGQEYSYKIRAYTNISSSYQHSSADSDSVSGVTKLKATGFTSATAFPDRVSLKWTSVSGATGYEIFRGTDKNGKYYKVKTVTPGSRHSYTDSGLKKGKNYYYKIRVYRKVNGINIYSDYSVPVHAKTK
ncbi:MAG: hypothetical protein HFI34_00675 [Lachnospiraceae bacterium]|nr:hypothetical protein [Lachnospiraceae bacterium]